MFVKPENEKSYINMRYEIWTFVPTTNGYYQISNLGRVRKLNYVLKSYGIHIYSNSIYELVEPKIVNRVYLDVIHKVPVVRITIHGMTFQKFPVSELMFFSFHGIANIQANEIIHLDGNEENNRLDNLIIAKPIFKLHYLAYKEFLDNNKIDSTVLKSQYSHVNCISKYSKNGELKQVFKNLMQVENEDQIARRFLLQNIKARAIYPIKDHFYKQGHGPQLLDISFVLNESIRVASFRGRQKSKVVLQYSKLGKLLAVFSDVQEASKSTQCLKQHIVNSIKTRQIFGHYLWVQLEDQQIEHPKHELHLALGHDS